MSDELLFIGTRCANVMKDDLDGSITVKDSFYSILSEQRRFYVDCDHTGTVFPGRLYVECDMDDCERDTGFYCDAIRFTPYGTKRAALEFLVLSGENHIYHLDRFGTVMIRDDIAVFGITMNVQARCIKGRVSKLFPTTEE